MFRKIKLFLKILKRFKNPLIYFLDYFRLLKQKFVIYSLKNNLCFCVRAGTKDRNVVNEIALYNLYTNNFSIKKEDIVVDVGAHIGIFSVYASKLASKGQVYALEPVKENFRILSTNKNLNNSDNLKIFNKGLFNSSKELEISLDTPNNTAKFTLYGKGKITEKIRLESFDTFIKQNKLKKIDFLKMDCEGSEYEIFFNLSKNNLKKINKIVLEYHNLDSKKNYKELVLFFERNNFKLVSHKRFGKLTGMLYLANKKTINNF